MDSSWPCLGRTSPPTAASRPGRAACGGSTARSYRECSGDDLKNNWGVAFPRLVKAKPGETVVFSWIVYKSRADRDRVNKKVMKDPRMAKMMNPTKDIFDVKRMAYGGFKVIVDL